MQAAELPPSLQDVAAPLDEAARYETWFLERQRGAFNLGTGLLFVVAAVLGLAPGWLDAVVLPALAVAMVALSFWAKRNRDRHPVFVEVGRIRDERAVRMVMAALFVAFGLDILAFELSLSAAVVRALTAASILAFCFGMATAARSRQDQPTTFAYWLAAGSAIPVALGLVPVALGSVVMTLSFAAPLLILGAYRAFAPRRWLQ